MSGRPSRALRRIAGHTFAGLLAFGGCIPTIMGIMPVEKLDLLLLGGDAQFSKAEWDKSLPRKEMQTCLSLELYIVHTSGSLLIVCAFTAGRSWSGPGQLFSAAMWALQHKSGAGA